MTVLIALVSGLYLVRLASPGRRHVDGLCAFGLSLAFAGVVLAVQLTRT